MQTQHEPVVVGAEAMAAMEEAKQALSQAPHEADAGLPRQTHSGAESLQHSSKLPSICACDSLPIAANVLSSFIDAEKSSTTTMSRG